MITARQVAPGIDVLTSDLPIPGFGFVPINAFVLHGAAPVLVDTGAVIQRDEFMSVLRTVIDPADLRWIWLTHTDSDHIGALAQLVAEVPQLRVITTFLGVGSMSLSSPLPMDRVHLLNPGQAITIGNRVLTAVRPPTFDNPVTTGFYDDATRALFSADCFGAVLPSVPVLASELSEAELRDAQILWATVDSPWLHGVDPAKLAGDLDRIRRIEPSVVLSSHLPAASGDMLERLLATVAAVPAAQPFTGPDQAALEHMLAEMTSAAVA